MAETGTWRASRGPLLLASALPLGKGQGEESLQLLRGRRGLQHQEQGLREHMLCAPSRDEPVAEAVLPLLDTGNAQFLRAPFLSGAAEGLCTGVIIQADV